MRIPVLHLATALALLTLPAAAFAAPKVVVSIKPIHSLVASIMDGVAEPEVIIKGSESPHTYQMRPSDAAAVESADVIFWIGPQFEKFLEKPVEALGSGKGEVVELDKAAGLTLLPPRETGMFEPHADEDHGHDGDGHEHEEEVDLHMWLSTSNARALAAAIAGTLSAADPANAARYSENLEKLNGRLDALAGEIRTIVAPVKDRPFIVFHDAYQYFEKEFGVNVAGSITVTPENAPGAKRIAEIHQKLETLGASCVFAEPQFEPKLVQVVLEGTQSKSGTLDPEAGTYQASPELYFDLMRGLATSIRDCLKS